MLGERWGAREVRRREWMWAGPQIRMTCRREGGGEGGEETTKKRGKEGGKKKKERKGKGGKEEERVWQVWQALVLSWCDFVTLLLCW